MQISGVSPRPQLFKSWLVTSAGSITIQYRNIRETNCTIQWIENYPVDSAIHLFNNWDQYFLPCGRLQCLTFQVVAARKRSHQWCLTLIPKNDMSLFPATNQERPYEQLQHSYFQPASISFDYLV